MDDPRRILVINAGSSSLKFAIFVPGRPPAKVTEGVIDKIGSAESEFIIDRLDQNGALTQKASAPDHASAANLLANWLTQDLAGQEVVAIGHRLVHGGPKYSQPLRLNTENLAEFRNFTIFDPEHLPIQISLVEALAGVLPEAVQVACFDTAFHRDLPTEARLLPIPRRYQAKGLRRYGFHGLSCSFIMVELSRLAGTEAAAGRIIIAHLGNGVSLTAVRGGRSIDTTMGLTPASGVPMSTRSGDLDPGLTSYLAQAEGLDAKAFSQMAAFESGLLGLSETTSDMKQLLAAEATDPRAREAVELFCYQVKKAIGGLAAALGGLDSLVFTGGMGEAAPLVRARICAGLDFLGIRLEPEQNQQNAGLISPEGARPAVRVIHTDEAAVVADQTWQLINEVGNSEADQKTA